MIKVGLERLEEYKDLFAGKNVGLITNPTGVNHQFKSTIDILNETTNLVALFSPEHGIRGDLQAGVRLDDYVDDATGAMVYSLYGKNKKPNKEMLENVDVLVFDVQDVGARFYTYIYTMIYSMEACKENDVTFVVLDRPNPVNGIDVEGNLIQDGFTSFVGNYGLTQRYGLTLGELALMINDTYNIHADVEVVKMSGYKRTMNYLDTGRHFVSPSPNIPTPETCYSYLCTCLFEGTNMSEGRGTTKPFSIVGSPYLDNQSLKEKLEALNLKGVKFRTLYFTPTFSKHAGELCKGIELFITDTRKFKPVQTGYILLDLIRKQHPEFKFLPPYKDGLNPMINLLTGSDDILTNKPLEDILRKLEEDTQLFKKIKRRYHIYE